MIPLKWLTVLMAAGTLLMPVVCEVPSNCNWLIPSDSGCVKDVDCSKDGDGISIWEDCAAGGELFEINDTSVSISSDCQYASGKTTVILTEELDAEDPNKSKYCTVGGRSKIFFFVVNINEFPPYPAKDTSPTTVVNVKENKKPGVVKNIYYKDDDLDETKDLTCVQTSPDYGNLFSLTPVDSADETIKTFQFSVNEELDFEDQVFYRMEYDIISTDSKNNKMSTKQTFFINVGDRPDMPPFWTGIVPVYALEECKVEDALFTVTAQDRDVDINYDIKYSMVEDPNGNYFKINETTGEVSRNAEIDREELLENGISSFSLTITATEYKEEGIEGEQPNNVQQVSVITILDCNDQKPMFDSSTYNITIDELTDESGDRELNLPIVVRDMDKDINGSYKLTTDDPLHLRISPESGMQSQVVTLTARWQSSENNYFNYEVQTDTLLNFTITATEDTDPSRFGNAFVTITLRDLNDNPPVFPPSPYKKSVKESKPKGSKLLTVEADDEDIHEDIGKPSISYSLESSCHQLEIDNTTGVVTLAIDLDFDDENTDNEIHCTVNGRDEFGTGLIGSSAIIISVIDVVDEPPWLQESDIPMTVAENTATGVVVDSFIVNDEDKGAYINFTIVSSVCSGEASTPTNIDSWFTVVPDTPKHPEYPAIVKVNGDTDREECSEVTLVIMAVDWETEENTNSVNATVVITITDVKDEPPVFVGDYEDLNIDEFNENDPPAEDSVFVFMVTVGDPDEGDTINLSISKGGDMVQLTKTVVTVEAGGTAQVEVKTKKGVTIDRETHDIIEVEIELTNDENPTTTRKNFIIKINDLNDKKPIMNPDLCDPALDPIHVVEDDSSGLMNGTFVHQIKATDGDIDSTYKTVTYIMLNDQLPDSKNLRTPFTVDEKTGKVSVLLVEDKKTLNREQDETWELLFTAFDQCRLPVDTNCKVLSSEVPCKVNIIVDDVNDNYPRDLDWMPKEDITVTDFLQKDEELGYQLWAYDDDKGENASLTYKVKGTFRPNGDEDMELFYAQDEDAPGVSSCRLYATKDFRGMNLTGGYTVTLEAKDGANRTTNTNVTDLATEFNITVTVVDGNDHAPQFEFEGCPGQDNRATIKMEENAYTPGEGGWPTKMVVTCEGPDDPPFNIRFSDADTTRPNRESVVKIDRVNSTVENAKSPESEAEQLSYWSLEPEYCEMGCNLYLSHTIDREKGTAYNLSLHIENRNTKDVLQESWATVRVVVTNVMEFDPYFCREGDCSQIVYMYENDPKAATYFMEATDLDNTNASPNDEEYDDVYYFIVGGDRNYFQTISDTQRKIVLKNMPEGLDREAKQSYSLKIFATNDPAGGNQIFDNISRSDLLQFIIRVGDVNDEKPIFIDDVIFSSFMESNSDGTRLTIIEADDLDLNETLKYSILDDLQWFDTDITPERSFRLEERNERSVYLDLDFDPRGMTRGYCNFTIRVEDAVGHRDETQVKIYIINEEYQVAMYFTNTVEDVKDKQNEIEEAYTQAYSYACVIESITPTQTSTGEIVSNETTVYMHFIDEEKDEPVKDNIILDLSDSATVMKELEQRLSFINISLYSVGTYFPPTGEKSQEDRILMLQILLGVISLVLGSLLVLLVTVSCIRTRSLKRKVKVLSTNTFGSKDSGLNHIGNDLATVPGSNLAKVHGNHNPVFSENGAFELQNKDTESISSGDSVLVGVEDNPEFKSYPAKGSASSSAKGFENSSFGRSIDEVSAPPPGVQGGMKGNPLLNLGSLQDTSGSFASSLDRHSFGDSKGSESDAASMDKKINSNFSFS